MDESSHILVLYALHLSILELLLFSLQGPFGHSFISHRIFETLPAFLGIVVKVLAILNDVAVLL